jgi:transposase-like protein
MKALKLKIAGGTAALAAVLGGGAAVAATQLDPVEESDAIVADAAKQLGVSAEELDAALTQALENRIDEAVAAGRLTETQAAELKERLEAGDVPLVGLGPGPGLNRAHHGFVDFAAASEYLGLSESELRESLREGETLAEIATANGKSAAGLVDALVAAAKADLDEKVADGRLTEAQRASILEDLEPRLEDVVEGEFSFGFRGGPGRHVGPPVDNA